MEIDLIMDVIAEVAKIIIALGNISAVILVVAKFINDTRKK